ncbi:GNAT family N-acetyltransferase [Sphingobacterium cellulitidis]|uniref:GNAT family N-acetyltransferase n=1 Tax=Sphingobacterium cellulitidis TaxID=1768011 RepID=UPI000B93C995|nr:GNAT family N-acetyltransferase [Sphingobacterium cellulitidis]OYD45366.1 GNAT family N-acetyltransferase [Sphingobacterium cellulitidis]
MKFRKAQIVDLERIVELLSDDTLGNMREAFRQPLPAEYITAFNKICEDKNQELIVLESDEGHVIGCMQLSFIQYLTYRGGIRAQLEGVRIDKKERSRGLGQKMIRYAIRQARERGAHMIQLTTDKVRPEALNFYENLGFKSSHEGMKLVL